MGEIIPFPAWIIQFPVLKINFETLGTNEKGIVREVFDKRPGSLRNNSVSCLDKSISCFEINFEPLGSNEKHVFKKVF